MHRNIGGSSALEYRNGVAAGPDHTATEGPDATAPAEDMFVRQGKFRTGLLAFVAAAVLGA